MSSESRSLSSPWSQSDLAVHVSFESVNPQSLGILAV